MEWKLEKWGCMSVCIIINIMLMIMHILSEHIISYLLDLFFRLIGLLL